MDYIFLQDAITSYSLPTLIIAVIVSAISILADVIFKDKIPTTLKINVPFFLAFLSSLIYDIVFVTKGFIIREEVVTFAIVCGSLSIVLIRIFSSIFNGEKLSADTTILLIEGIIEDLVLPTSIKAVSVKIKEIIDTATSKEEQKSGIIELIVVNTDKDLSSDQIESVAMLILKTVSAI